MPPKTSAPDLVTRMVSLDSSYDVRAASSREEQKPMRVAAPAPTAATIDATPAATNLSGAQVRKLATADRMEQMRQNLKDTRQNVAWRKKIAAKKPAAPPAISRVDMGSRFPEPLLIDPDCYDGGGPRARGMAYHELELMKDDERERRAKDELHLLRKCKKRVVEYGLYPSMQDTREQILQMQGSAEELRRNVEEWRSRRRAAEARCDVCISGFGTSCVHDEVVFF